MDLARTALLTDAQRECLRLVLTHHSSKEIANLLGVSPSAIDKRIERAVQITGAPSRFAAARLLAEEEGRAAAGIGDDERGDGQSTSEWTTSEAIDLSEPNLPQPEDRQDEPRWVVRRLLGLGRAAGTGGRTRNNLSKPQRLGLIAAVIVFVAISSMALLNMGQTLSRVLLDHRVASSR